MKTTPKVPRPEAALSRRQILRGVAALGAVGLAAGGVTGRAAEGEVYRAKNGKVRQSVVPWCFKPMTLAELCVVAVRLGLPSVELTTPNNFPLLKQHGLVCALTSSHGFAKGFARGGTRGMPPGAAGADRRLGGGGVSLCDYVFRFPPWNFR